jgi:HAD superfamily hydrolase (TIGR01549 family)
MPAPLTAKRASRGSRPSVASFDVFDTLLVRARARHLDIFREAAERAVSDAGPGDVALIAEAARRRKTAELEAIDRAGVDAVALPEIYDGLEDLRQLGFDPGAMMAAELAIEAEEVRPIEAGRLRVRAAREAGLQVVFVSDMYLPTAAIREPLERFGFAKAGERLYVSGELGVSKRTGRMFEHVLSDLGVQPEEMIHTGDDPVTDRQSPERLGIQVDPLTIGRPNRFEREISARLAVSRPVLGELVGRLRCARLADAGETQRAEHAAAYGAGVAGPLFTAYVAWVLRTAREAEIQRLYFVSRDAQVFLRIAQEIRRDDDPACSYLLGSRQAWFLPGIRNLDRKSLHWVLKPEWASRTPRSLLIKLGVDADEVPDVLRSHGLAPDLAITQEQIPSFWKLVGELEPLILSRVDSARRATLAYLRQEGLLGAGRWALVDLGWRLTAQSALRSIIRGESEHDAMGFYFALNSRRSRLADSGQYRGFLIEDDAGGRPGLFDDWVYCHQDLIEQVFAMADHGSCAGYEFDGDTAEPRLRIEDEESGRTAFGKRLQDTIVSTARELHDSGLLSTNLEAIRDAGLTAGRLAVEEPSREEASALGWIPVGDDQNESRKRPLAAPLPPASLASRIKGADSVDGAFENGSLWPEGSLALSSPPLRAALALAADGRKLIGRRDR